MSEEIKVISDQEESRLGTIKQQIDLTFKDEKADRDQLGRKISALKADKLAAESWRQKKEIDDEIYEVCQASEMRMFQEKEPLIRNPYFGVLEIDDHKLGRQRLCLGKRTFFNQKSQALIIDWREAPISRLYYEYEKGDEYEEDIGELERSGTIRCKRKVNTTHSILTEIVDGQLSLVKTGDGKWEAFDPHNITKQRQEAVADHHLQEITAFISSEQFRSITQPGSGIVVLEGGAGSGKTTVGLHRISYLLYQEPGRYGPGSILAVMFNRSLQTYISKALKDLDINRQAVVETFHGWASSLFRKNRVQIAYTNEFVPREVAGFKKSARLLPVLDSYIKRLHRNSVNWLLEKLNACRSSAMESLKSRIAGTKDLKALNLLLDGEDFLADDDHHGFLEELQRIITRRLSNHLLDLHQVLTDRELIATALGNGNAESSPINPDHVVAWQNNLQQQGKIDFNDSAILVWIMQAKGVDACYDHFEHVMVDEAQDLSPLELTTLIGACKKENSMTICGDMAQKIKGDVSFENGNGFSGFLDKLVSDVDADHHIAVLKRSTRLSVGYRATRQIMELAWQVLGKKGRMTSPKDGAPVDFYQTSDFAASVTQTAAVLNDYRQANQDALVGVICRKKETADSVFRELKQRGINGVRRHQRDDFTFVPGVVVTNAHQVKGLEFSAVVVFNPGRAEYIDNDENRMLLHVVITRATNKAWLIGHDPMAYDINKS